MQGHGDFDAISSLRVSPSPHLPHRRVVLFHLSPSPRRRVAPSPRRQLLKWFHHNLFLGLVGVRYDVFHCDILSFIQYDRMTI